MSESSEIEICKICQKELGEFEKNTSRHDYHFDCENCIHCNERVSEGHIAYCLKKELPITCVRCYEKYVKAELEKQPVIVTQGMLNYLNDLNLMFDVNMEVSPETNQMIASNLMNANYTKWWKDKPLEDQFVLLKRMESITVAFSILLDKQKGKMKLAIEQHEITRIREQQNDIVNQEKMARRKKIERADPMERNFRKAVEGLMAIGLSEDAAIKTIKGREKVQ